MKAERRTIEPGTARKPAFLKRAAFQPLNLESTLSHHAALPGPPGMTLMSLRRNDSSTAFFSHWLTCHLPLGPRSATRACPESRSSTAELTALCTAPLVFGPILSRCSKASSMILASLSDMAPRVRPAVCRVRGALCQAAHGKPRPHTKMRRLARSQPAHFPSSQGRLVTDAVAEQVDAARRRLA